MHRKCVVGLLLMIGLGSMVFVSPTHAAGSSTLVISQLKAGNSSTSRLVEVYNNASHPTEVTGWCFYYSSPLNTLPYSKLGCFEEPNSLVHVFLPSHTYALSASSQVGIQSDMLLSLGLGNGTTGHVYVKDGSGIEIDRIGWGTAVNAEGLHPVILPVSKVIERKKTIDPAVYADTDDNANDFIGSVLRTQYTYGSLYEIEDLCTNITGIQQTLPDGYSVDSNAMCTPPPVDMCTNIDGLQIVLPNGYLLDENSDCRQDVCSNLSGLQLTLPVGKDYDTSGQCIDHDVCLNVDDIQTSLPTGYLQDGADCLLSLLPIRINEMLPNAVGSDDGNEFIELYNPNVVDVDLTLYRLQVGLSTTKTYAFAAGAIIQAGGYMSFTNDDIAFTLVNTTSQVAIMSADGQLIDQAPSYSNPYDGMVWELYDALWQFSDQPTSGAANLPSLPVEVIEDAVTGLTPCAPNQYRNPETNRCRLVVIIGSTLSPCKDGQYRSEETNRCRNLGSDLASLVQCAEGQDRNPLTSRCRTSLFASATLTPCKENQERNTDTNRCRTVAKITQADFAPQPVATSNDSGVGLIALSAVIAAALSYAIWEWRVELARLFLKLRTFLHLTK